MAVRRSASQMVLWLCVFFSRDYCDLLERIFNSAVAAVMGLFLRFGSLISSKDGCGLSASTSGMTKLLNVFEYLFGIMGGFALQILFETRFCCGFRSSSASKLSEYYSSSISSSYVLLAIINTLLCDYYISGSSPDSESRVPPSFCAFPSSLPLFLRLSESIIYIFYFWTDSIILSVLVKTYL